MRIWPFRYLFWSVQIYPWFKVVQILEQPSFFDFSDLETHVCKLSALAEVKRDLKIKYDISPLKPNQTKLNFYWLCRIQFMCFSFFFKSPLWFVKDYYPHFTYEKTEGLGSCKTQGLSWHSWLQVSFCFHYVTQQGPRSVFFAQLPL